MLCILSSAVLNVQFCVYKIRDLFYFDLHVLAILVNSTLRLLIHSKGRWHAVSGIDHRFQEGDFEGCLQRHGR